MRYAAAQQASAGGEVMGTLSRIIQPHVRVKVEYYNDDEKTKFAAYPPPEVALLNAAVGKTVPVPTSTFLTFYLFQQMRQGIDGLDTVAQLMQNLDLAEGAIGYALHFDGQSVRLPTAAAAKSTPAGQIELLGEAIGLSVMSHIHKLNESDWQRLPEPVHAVTGLKMMGFDYHQAAVNAQSLIQMEAKGAAMDDNRLKTNLAQKAASIREKKAALKAPVDGTPDLAPNAIRYGTIAAVDPRPGSVASCRLVDPEPEPSRWTPLQFKTIARIHFLTQLLAYISPRSPLTTALASRHAALLRVSDPMELDRVPLVHGDGKPFLYEPKGVSGTHSTFFAGKSRVHGMGAGGTAFKIGERTIAFIGLKQELIDHVAAQDFEAIDEYRTQPGSSEESVRFTMSNTRSEDLPSSRAIPQVNGTARPEPFDLSGQLHVNTSGMVFGFFELPP